MKTLQRKKSSNLTREKFPHVCIIGISIIKFITCTCFYFHMWIFFFSFLFFFFLLFLGLHPWHMEVSRLGIKSELQLLAYATATATHDLSCVCDLHHSSLQCCISNLLSETRGWTRILMDTSQICFCCVTMGTPYLNFASTMWWTPGTNHALFVFSPAFSAKCLVLSWC